MQAKILLPVKEHLVLFYPRGKKREIPTSSAAEQEGADDVPGGSPVQGEDVKSRAPKDQSQRRGGVPSYFVWLQPHSLKQGMMCRETQQVPTEFMNEPSTACYTAKLPNTTSLFILRFVLIPKPGGCWVAWVFVRSPQ